MNELLLKLFKIIPRKPNETKIVMGGLRDSGKSTILYQLAYKSESTTVPTPAFNKQVFKYYSRIIHLWDLGAHETRRFFFWDNLAIGAKGLMYVVDTSSPELLPESKVELDRILKLEAIKGLPLLIYANKIDQKQLELEGLANQLGLFNIHDREWYVQPANANERAGLFEGFDWLLETIRKEDGQPNQEVIE